MYGIIQTLLKDNYNLTDTVLIESPFAERTRLGLYCETVLLAITPEHFVIASEKRNGEYKRKRSQTYDDLNIENVELDSIFPLNTVTISVFKRTRRQSLKVIFNNMATRYFELGKIPTRKIFWKLWCGHVNEIRNGSFLWPYVIDKSPEHSQHRNTLRWTDKYVYLGPKRHAEDQIRPVPISGLGTTEDIKLLYLKPENFESWDQGEHWVKCDEERETTMHDYELYTYTGGPTSNITYTSLMTTVGIIGQF